MRPGTNKVYYVYTEDEGGIYVDPIDEKGVLTLVLDTETDKWLTTDLIMEEDTDRYFTQPSKPEDGNDTETISSTSTADYNREEVETSLANIAEAFHTIGSKYEHLCAIVPHMTKVQAANVISRLPIRVRHNGTHDNSNNCGTPTRYPRNATCVRTGEGECNIN